MPAQQPVGLALTYAAQLAKTTLFASGNEANVRKTAAGRFSNKLEGFWITMEVNQLKRQLKDLGERIVSLRGFL